MIDATTKNQPTLLFVYNANSGPGNALLDYGKKYLAPSKYDCQLCMLSYGPFGMKKEWRQFTSDLPYLTEFLHKDELKNGYPDVDVELPAIVLVDKSNKKPEILISSHQFSRITGLSGLKKELLRAVSKLD